MSSFFFKNLGIIVLLVLVLSLIFRSFYRPALFLFLFFVISYSFDYFYYSRLLFRFSPIDFTFLQPYQVMKYDPETIRFNFFKKWYNTLGGKTPLENEALKEKLWTLGPFRTRHCLDNKCTTYAGNKYPFIQPRSENSLRFLLWGGSLSAGTTLNNLEQSYPDVIYRRLQAMFPDKKVELMNTSRGEIDFRNFQDIEMDNKHFYPDYFLIDAFVINNHHEFEETIKKLSTYKSQKVLLKPPINPEMYDQKDLDHVREKIAGGLSDNPEYYYQLRLDPFIKRWQQQYDLAYIDGNLKLLSPEVLENGQLFWDMVHLTAYGHEAWGEYLALELAEMIKKRAP
jgi:lysophospholipase L1-like esterase